MSRVRAVLRRASEEAEPKPVEVRFGDLAVNYIRREVLVRGVAVNLTKTEYRLLETMVKEAGRTFSQLELIERVFGFEYAGVDRTIDVHVMNLRKKIEPDTEQFRYVVTRPEWVTASRINMWQSLKYKMLSAMVLVVISGVVITALYATRSTTDEFQKYVTLVQTMRERRFAQFLTDYYDNGQTWEGVQPLITQLAAISGERIVLADVKGVIVADSQQTLVGKTAGSNWNSKIVNTGDATVGYLYFNPLINAETSTTDYIVSVTRSVWVGALIAVAIALFATLLLSRSILHPIEDLTIATRKMQTGDLSA